MELQWLSCSHDTSVTPKDILETLCQIVIVNSCTLTSGCKLLLVLQLLCLVVCVTIEHSCCYLKTDLYISVFRATMNTIRVTVRYFIIFILIR